MNGSDPNATTTSTPVPGVAPAEPVTPATVPPTMPTPVAPGVAAASSAPTGEPAMPSVYEATPVWAPSEPVVKSRPRDGRGRGSRVRWAVALAVIALVIGASAVVAALIVGQAPQATVLGYVPDRTIAYAEVRLDLPGDQRKAVGEFLSHFPGFQDQAALDSKLDEVLDQIVKDATEGEQTYTGDIEPWFDGEIAVAVGPLPPVSSITDDLSAMSSFRALVLMSIKDAALAQAWFDAAFQEMGVASTTESYGGASLTVFSEADGVKGAFAILGGEVAVAGDLTSVKAAVDTNGSSGFADEPGPKAAFEAASDDHIGFVYVALRPIMAWSGDLDRAGGSMFGGATGAVSDSILDILPEWGAYWLRVESDAIVMEAVAPEPAGTTGPTNDRASTIVDHIPVTSVVAAVSNDAGKSLAEMLAQVRSDPTMKEAFASLDQALGVLGGPEAALGWIGDTAVVVNVADGTPEGGLLVIPTDAADARQFFTSLRALIALGGSEVGAAIRDEAYAGTTITIVSLGDIGDLADKSGMSPELGGGVTLPEGDLEIAYAVTDDLIVIGSGPGFVKHVLDTTKETSLGGNDRYQQLADRAGDGSSSVFVDIRAIRSLVEDLIPPGTSSSDLAEYEENVKPFLEPFDAMITSSSTSGDLGESTFIITVK